MCTNKSFTIRPGMLKKTQARFHVNMLIVCLWLCTARLHDGCLWLSLFLSASNSLQCLFFFSPSLSCFSLYCWRTKDKQKQRRAVEAQQACCGSPRHPLKVRNMNLRIQTSLDDKHLSISQKESSFHPHRLLNSV